MVVAGASVVVVAAACGGFGNEVSEDEGTSSASVVAERPGAISVDCGPELPLLTLFSAAPDGDVGSAPIEAD